MADLDKMAGVRIDGLQYSNYDRELFEDLIAAGLHTIHVTLAYWEDARQCMTLFSKWNRHFIDHADLIMPVKTGDDIVKAKELGKVGIVFGAQNCSPIDAELGLVQVMNDLGLKFMQLTYNNQSLIGAGCFEDEDPGISRFGKNVIAEMNSVGMVIDMSHSAERTTLEAIDISSRPISITHANPTTFKASRRSKSHTVLKSLTDRGGMLGFVLYPLFLKDGADTKLEDFTEMVADTADKYGVDNIGIGSDLCRKWPYEVVEWMRNGSWTHETVYGEGGAGVREWPKQPDWFQKSSDFIKIEKGLVKQGFHSTEIDKILGFNWYRFMDESFKPA